MGGIDDFPDSSTNVVVVFGVVVVVVIIMSYFSFFFFDTRTKMEAFMTLISGFTRDNAGVFVGIFNISHDFVKDIWGRLVCFAFRRKEKVDRC